MDGESYDVAKSCPVSCRAMNQYGGTTCMPNFSEWIRILLDAFGQANSICTRYVSFHKLLISILNWGWKDSICQKLCRDLFYVGIIFFSQSLSKHHVVWENDSAKWNLAFSFEDTKETGWPSVREIGVKELANPIFALFKRSCRAWKIDKILLARERTRTLYSKNCV